MNAGDSKTVSFKSRMSILLEKKPPNKVYISEELDDLLKKLLHVLVLYSFSFPRPRQILSIEYFFP